VPMEMFCACAASAKAATPRMARLRVKNLMSLLLKV
jgi:hypothetical protein